MVPIKVVSRKKKIAECFLKYKKEIHDLEDPPFLEDLSDVLDLRNWNLKSFDPSCDENEDDTESEKAIEDMMAKLKTSSKFYEDLDAASVESEVQKVLRMVYENEKSYATLAAATKKEHIIEQWTYLRNKIPLIHENEQPLCFRIVKRGAIAPNAQTGCERANSVYNQFKTTLSVRMKLPMIKARLRIKTNGPPTSMFKPKAVRELWLKNGHQYAKTATQNKVVIERIRNEDREKYTSKIFD